MANGGGSMELPGNAGTERREREGMFHAAMGFATAIDNYLILMVKKGKFTGKKLEAVLAEASEYQSVIDRLTAEHSELQGLMDELAAIHEKLWYIEDRKRVIERGEEEEVMLPRLLSEGGEADLIEYLQLSRQVSKFNDIRATIKRKMNEITGSALVEVKSHKTVGGGTEEPMAAAVKPPEKKATFEERPWGRFDILEDKPDRKVKSITVNPGMRLSLQSHEMRGEHWTVVSGEADVTLDDEVVRVNAGESIFIPRGARHRAANPGKVPLVFIEVQVGSYFGEDDIQRYQDDFGRAGNEAA